MKKIGIITLVVLTCSAFVCALSLPAFAEDQNTYPDVGSEYADRGYLIVSPNRLMFDGVLEPLKSYSSSFRAINVGGAPITFDLTVEPFSVTNETYEAVYSEPSNRTRITDWITFPGGKEFTLDPQEDVEIIVRVNIPRDAIGGGQYAAVMANIHAPVEGTSSPFQATARIAIPLFSTVKGDIIFKGAIISHDSTAFTFSPIIKTSTILENTGNADYSAKYHLTITSAWNNEITYEDTQEKLILPDTKRIFEQNWDSAPALGFFNLEQQVTDFQKERKGIHGTMATVRATELEK